MTQYAQSDLAFIAFATQDSQGRALSGTEHYKPGQKLAVPAISSHSLAYDVTRQDKNYVDGFRTLGDAPSLSGSVSGDVQGPLYWSAWYHQIMSRVMKSFWGRAERGRTPPAGSMLVGNWEHAPFELEALFPTDAGTEIAYRYMAAMPTGFTVSFTPQDPVTINTSFLGRDLNRNITGSNAGKTISFEKDNALVYVRDKLVQVPGHKYKISILNQANGSLLYDYCITSAELSVQNDAELTYCIGSKSATGMRTGAMTVGVNMTLLTVQPITKLLQHYINDGILQIRFLPQGLGNYYQFTLPYCRVASVGTPLEGPNGLVSTNVSFTGTANPGGSSYWRSPILVQLISR